jgi:DNA invertase Pin-like site-specific DNA recombinase
LGDAHWHGAALRALAGHIPTVRRQAAEILAMKAAGKKPAEIADYLGVSRASVYRVLASPDEARRASS